MRTHLTFADTPLFADALLDTGIWPDAANTARMRFIENDLLFEHRAELHTVGRLEVMRLPAYGTVLPVHIRPKKLAQGGIVRGRGL